MTRILDWMRTALIDLRGDFRRFGILLACLALGTATIAGVSSVGEALQAAIQRDANVLLGGDLQVARPDRRANAEELAYFQSLGTVSETISTNSRGDAMDDSGNSVFLDVYGVDGNYPLYGNVVSPQLTPGQKPADLLTLRDGVHGAIADIVMMDALGLDVGGHFKINGVEFEVRGVLNSLPNSALRGFRLGKTVVVSIEGQQANPSARTPLPGLLSQYSYKIKLNEGDYTTAKPLVQAHFESDPQWKVQSPYDAAGNLARFYDMFVRFLLIVGLSSLLVGGVGISNAVTAYISERQRSIATLRSLGSTGPRIMVHFFTQIGLMSLIGIVLGLVVGAALTAAALPVLGRILAVNLPPSIEWGPLGNALAFGVLAAFAFSFLPLVRAEKLRPALLFRSVGSAVPSLKLRDYFEPLVILPLLAAAFGIFGLAWITTHDFWLVFWYTVGVVGAVTLLSFAGKFLQWLLRILPPPNNAVLRKAFIGIYRPGSPAPVVIMSLGLGLAMLLVIVVLTTNLHDQLLSQVLKNAPTFVATDMFDDEVADLEEFTTASGMTTRVQYSPQIKAAITKVNGVDSAVIRDKPDVSGEALYMLTGEILMTWAADLPPDSTVTKGTWWASDYAGPPLVSLRAEDAGKLGVKVGDTLELTLYGETLEVTIANLRDFKFQTGLNFLVTASPGTFDAFPPLFLATIKAVPGKEKELERALAKRYPEITFLPIGEALDQAAGILTQLSTAVNIVGALAVLNGALVLAGTMAAGRKQREADAVVNKVLGSTRGDVVRVFALEYALLGAFAALIATIVGIAGAWAITTNEMDVAFAVDGKLILGVLAGSVALTIVTGAVTTWSALSTRPAQYLRALG